MCVWRGGDVCVGGGGGDVCVCGGVVMCVGGGWW